MKLRLDPIVRLCLKIAEKCHPAEYLMIYMYMLLCLRPETIFMHIKRYCKRGTGYRFRME